MQDTLWTCQEAADATDGECTADWTAMGVSIDSRTVRPDELFVAIAGPNFDGHDFVAQALKSGAAGALVHRVPGDLPQGSPLLLVGDTMAGLTGLAAAARARVGAKVVAVTGSVGKTGTKEALRLVLADQAVTHASAGSLNNQWGSPLSLARMPRDTAFGIFELGMNHAGELTPLSRLLRPHVALITNVEAVHLAHFNSVEEIAAAKAEIFEGLEVGGTAVLNRDNPHFDFLAGRARAAGAARIIGFGAHREAEARLIKQSLHAECSCVAAEICGQAITYKIGAPGAHWVVNSLGVLAVVSAVGADLGRAGLTLAGMSAPKGRGQRHTVRTAGGTFLLIDESYNASPVAVRAALATLGAASLERSGRRIAVLGDMLELGNDAANLHAGLAKDIHDNKIDLLFSAGSQMAHLSDAIEPERRGCHAADSAALLETVVGSVRPGDVVLVKGSLGSRMAPIVEALMDLGETPVRAANG